MTKKMKIWLIVAASLVLLGCVLFGGVMAGLHWDFTGLSTVNYDTHSYAIQDGYDSISIRTDTADVVLVPSGNGESTVVCYEPEGTTHTVTVADGRLIIEVTDTRKWYEHIGISFGTPTVTVSMPSGEYDTLSVQSDTGAVDLPGEFRFQNLDISGDTGRVTCRASVAGTAAIALSTGSILVEDLTAGSLDLSTSTGSITVSRVVCEGDLTAHVSTGKTVLPDIIGNRVVSNGDTGDLFLTKVTAAESFSIERDTGDVRFDGCDAAEMVVTTDTGDVTGTLLSEKIFFVKTDTGRVDVPKGVSGGRCEIATDTGDVHIQIDEDNRWQ